MPTMTTSDVLVMIVALGTVLRWWVDRRDARSALAKSKEKAEKTVTTLIETITEKNTEIGRAKEERDYWMQRAMHAETRLDALMERGA